MEKMKHTPGPWKYTESKRGYLGQPEGRMTQFYLVSQDIENGHFETAAVCSCDFGGRTFKAVGDPNNVYVNLEMAEANAKLIAAAPDLLDALEELMRFEASLRMVMFNKLQAPEPFLKAMDNAEEAIKKARGL